MLGRYFADKNQFRTQRIRQTDLQPMGHQFASSRLRNWRTSILKMKLVRPGGIKTSQDKAVLCFGWSRSSEGEYHALAACRVPILSSIPIHSIRTRRHVIQACIADQRAQLLLVECNGIPSRLVLFRGPCSRI